MSTEQLPDDLQMAYEFARAVWPVSGTTADKRMSASDAIRTEHTQRMTLQHHACDLAQRIADLERHAASLVSESESKSAAMQAAFEERLTLDRANRVLVAKNADLEVKCVTLKELHDAATDERDALRVKVYDLERAPAQAVPAGWRLVPVEPTIAMCNAGDRPRILVDDCTPTPAIYRAMIAAVPEHKAVLLTDEQIEDALCRPTASSSWLLGSARAIETAVLAANALGGAK